MCSLFDRFKIFPSSPSLTIRTCSMHDSSGRSLSYTCVQYMIQTFWLCFNFYTRVSDMIQTFWLCFILVFQKWSRRSGCLILVFHTDPIALYLCSKHASAVQTMLYIRAPYIIQPFWLFLYLFVAFCTNADVYFRGVLSVTIIWSKSDI